MPWNWSSVELSVKMKSDWNHDEPASEARASDLTGRCPSQSCGSVEAIERSNGSPPGRDGGDGVT